LKGVITKLKEQNCLLMHHAMTKAKPMLGLIKSLKAELESYKL
jgi:hypothetical protein